ncbi:MAG TPA: ABC transporter permease subunit [Candidatus Atribacteria bacterium]|nr:ABC transporter permease subunit [Candidatus Atribacteria bacterium]
MSSLFSLARRKNFVIFFRKTFLGAVGLYVLLPFIPLFMWSFTKSWFWPSLLPNIWGLRAWRYSFSPYSKIIEAIWITILLALVVTFLNIIICLLPARVLGQRQFKRKQFIRLFILSPLIVPSIAVALGVLDIFIRLRLANTFLGVVIAQLIPTIPYMVMILSAVFENFDVAFEEQAKSLGAGPIKTFFYITLPMIMPGIIAGSLFTFLVSFNEFVLTFLVGGGKVITLSVLLFNFMGGEAGYDFPITAALAIIMSIPGIIFLFITEKAIKEEFFALGFQ